MSSWPCKDLVFGDADVHSNENMGNDLDSKWIGLSFDQISEMVGEFGCDEVDTKKYMIKSISFRSGGLVEFLEL